MIGMELSGVIVIIIFLLFRVGHSYFKFKKREQEMSSWKRLAQTTSLKFIPGSYMLEGACVKGKYRGYIVKVEAVRSNKKDREGNSTLVQLINAVKTSPDPEADDQIITNDFATWFDPEFPTSVLHPDITGTIAVDYGSLRYKEIDIDHDVEKLKIIIDYLCDLAGMYPYVISLGGLAVSFLQPVAASPNILKPLAAQLLCEIQLDTARRFERKLANICCRDCLTRFFSHKVKLGFLSSVNYYACRKCKLSNKYYDLEGLWIVLVMDHQMKDDLFQQDNLLRVNWLQRQELFDFDEIEIGQATDEDVTRFAVKVGNDNDPIRIERYINVECTVSATSSLSENTLHILRQIFGQVQIEQTP